MSEEFEELDLEDLDVDSEGRIPLVLMLEEGLYNQLMRISHRKNLTPQQFMEIYLSMLLDEDDGEEGDIEKLAEDVSDLEEDENIEDWSVGSDLPPPVSDGEPVEGFYGDVSEEDNAIEKHKKRIVRYTSSTVDELESVLEKIHEKKSSDINLSISFDKEGEVRLNINYPEDGMTLDEIYTYSEDGLNSAFRESIARLSKWEDLAFGPKLEEGTNVMASIDAKVLEFDKTIGKYKVRLGEGLIIDVGPEDLDKL